MVPVLAVGACAVGEDLADDPSFHGGADAGFASTGSRGAGGAATQGSAAGTSNNDGIARTGSSAGGTGAAPAASSDVSTTGSGGAETAGTGTGSGTGVGGDEGTAGADSGFDGSLAVDSASGCVSSQKSCGGRCVVPSPSFGCGLSGCDACAASPQHGVAKCTGLQCDFDCSAGYAKIGASCVVSEGGSDGSAGDAISASDGGSGSCVASQCGGCIPFIQAPCCKSDKTCGCQYPFASCK